MPAQKNAGVQKTSARASESTPTARASTVYKDFAIWTRETSPSWHPVKKMRYVFYRMIGGCTITDALAELHWNASEFWHLVDLKRNGPFRIEYKRAKLLQGRALADQVIVIAEGRDGVTRASRKRVTALLRKALARAAKSKNGFKAKMIVQQLMNDLRESERDIMTRNKLQIDGTKWLASKVNPDEYGEKSSLSLASPDGDTAKKKPLVIQFVGPDGKAVAL